MITKNTFKEIEQNYRVCLERSRKFLENTWTFWRKYFESIVSFID